jgi:hypothetical protein
MKLNKLISLGLGLCLSGTAMAATPVHFTDRLLTGTYLCLSNSVTFLSGSTNQVYYSYSAGTNVLAGATNGANMTIASPLGFGDIVPDVNADVNPNLALQVIVGYTNKLFLAGVQSPVMLNTVWTNPVPFMIPGTGQTNTLTVTLTPVSSGDFLVADTAEGLKSFTVVMGQTNGVASVVTTNLPVGFLQGCAKFSVSLACGTGTTNAAGAGIVVDAVNLVGWKP